MFLEHSMLCARCYKRCEMMPVEQMFGLKNNEKVAHLRDIIVLVVLT